MGILFCLSQFPLRYFRACSICNSFVYSVLHLWKHIPHLKLSKYWYCITDQKCGWQAVLGCMESVLPTAAPLVPFSPVDKDKVRGRHGSLLCSLMVDFYFYFCKPQASKMYKGIFLVKLLSSLFFFFLWMGNLCDTLHII